MPSGGAKEPSRSATPGTIKSTDQAVLVASGSGLARRLPKVTILTADDCLRALSGFVLRSVQLDKERLACIKLLGEHYGLWGVGRKAPPEEPAKPETFEVK